MEQATANINKLVSLTFDENPEIRKQAARSLGAIDDPAAVFALVELTYDKDPAVKELAQNFLEGKRKTEPELMSFASIFSAGAKKEEHKVETPADAKAKMLRPITDIFEKRLGKEKAEMAKTKLMPSIEKVYQKAQHQGGKKKDDNRKVMQEFLTNYLEVMSDLDRIGDGSFEKEPEPRATEAPAAPAAEAPREAHPESGEAGEADLEVVGRPSETDRISEEVASLELQEMEELKEREEIEHLPDTFFKKAYEIMMASGGDEDMMRQEMNRMIADAQREIGLAFRMARKKFKEMKITNITKITDGMRNVNTELLIVKAVENMEYQKTKKQKATVSRILVNDESGNEGILYLFDDRGVRISAGMRIKVVKGLAKTFEFSGETALTLGKRGNVYIVL